VTSAQLRTLIIGCSYLVVAALGWIGCHFWERPVSVPVTEHAQACHGDVCLAARSSTPQAPAQPIPKTATPQATFHAVVAGGKPEARTGVTPAQATPCEALLQCPAVTLNGTLVKDKDGQQDLYLSTGGQMVQEADFHPAGHAMVPREHPNRISLSKWSGGGLSGAYERDLWGPMFAGVQAGKFPVLGAEIAVTVGVRL
jgi:hypothetical protein